MCNLVVGCGVTITMKTKNTKISYTILSFALSLFFAGEVYAQASVDYKRALKRAQYLLNSTTPTDSDFATYSGTHDQYRSAVRNFIESEDFYPVLMRYHQRLFGVGLPNEYMDELVSEDIDNRTNKFAQIECARQYQGNESRFKCYWASQEGQAGCSEASEQPVSVFWYPEIVAWVCPSILQTCGPDLSRCFIQYWNQDEARNSELGTTETFDSRFAVIKSLSLQSAGLATAVAVENYSYRTILQPGISAIDGAIAHFYRQTHHFKVDQLQLPQETLDIVNNISLDDTRFKLINTGDSYESAGIISTFGWLRRYSKNRTRANQLYERMLCRKFTSELPRVFPQDPGNLRETEGCSGCHATLDPLADFFLTWGEGGELYLGSDNSVQTFFNGQTGQYLSDLSRIISEDQAFATCQVQNVWEWLIGRQFYFEEETLRTRLTEYFINTNYSFKELVFAVATHPVFMSAAREDATVTDPLEEPPLGTIAGATERECPTETLTWAADIQPKLTLCTGCHDGSGGRQDLTTEPQWVSWGSQSVNMMSSGTMPPGQFGPEVDELKEAVRCWLEQNE